MTERKAAKSKYALKHLILMIYILMSSNSCDSVSLLTDIKRQTKDQDSLLDVLQNVSITLMRQLTEETLIRDCTSKTFSDIRNDIETMKKALTETQLEMMTIKEENKHLRNKVSENKLQIATFEQTRAQQDNLISKVKAYDEKLNAVGSENKALKKQNWEYEKQFSNLTLTLVQIGKQYASLLTESNMFTRNWRSHDKQNEILKKQSLEYENQIAEFNISLAQMQYHHGDITRKSNIIEKAIQNFSADINTFQRQNMKFEEHIIGFNVSLLQLHQEQSTLKAETKSQKDKIKEFSNSSNVLEKLVSENKKALVEIKRTMAVLGGKRSNPTDIAQATCVALAPNGWTSAVPRDCGSKKTCNTICAGATTKIENAINYESAKLATCFNALHFAYAAVDPAKRDKAHVTMYKYGGGSCGQAFCGPNFCCCRV